MQPRTERHVKGIDVSHHQREIDWQKMKSAGVRFVYIKATEGATYRDPAMLLHYTGAEQAGLKAGFYHYARPYNDPRREVDNLLAATDGLVHDLPYALDIETNEGKFDRTHIAHFCKVWLEEIEKRTGERAVLYTYTHFAKAYLDASLSRWPLWIAHYNVGKPGENGIWTQWAVWQYTSGNDGLPYPGDLDVDVMEPEFFDGGWRKAQVEESAAQAQSEESADREHDDDGAGREHGGSGGGGSHDGTSGERGQGGVSGEQVKAAFSDVPSGHWAEEAIRKAAKAGIMRGVAENKFDPEGPVTRAQMAVILERLGLLDKGDKEADQLA